MINYLTAGESHGKALTTIIEGIPANLSIKADDINKDLQRRQVGYGRGGRMQIEKDRADILSGIRFGKTIGSPISIAIWNKDWENWTEKMAVEGNPNKTETVTHLRPGHADMAGAIKYNQKDIRNILERSSARETAARVAVGAVAKRLIGEFGIKIFSRVLSIGSAGIKEDYAQRKLSLQGWQRISEAAEKSDLRCTDKTVEKKMKELIDKAKKDGDTLGGIFQVVILGTPVGLGSYVQWNRRLDGNLARAIMSIQAIKGVEIGAGFTQAAMPGSQVHDQLYYEETYQRKTNRAGGLEGGMSNGEPIVIQAAMKPIATMQKPLNSIDLQTKKAVKAHFERSDTCAVPAAAVVGEAVCAIEIANALIEKFGGDEVGGMKEAWKRYLKNI